MTAVAHLDGTVYINNEPNIVDVTRANPGQTFVGILPGHDRPAFVRKRRRSGSCFTDLFRLRHTYSSEHVYHTYTESTPYYFNKPCTTHETKIVTDRPVFITSGSPSVPDRLKKHTCGSCGKFRSATYCQTHPLAEGEIPKPSLCRKCVHGKTSSGESDRSYENFIKKQKRRRRRQEIEDDNRNFEQYRRDQRRPRLSSAGDSFEKSRETLSYQRRVRGDTESTEDSGYWSYEKPKMRPRRVIYVDRSDSRRCIGSSSGDRSVVSISFKSEAPKRLRRTSRSRSSAEEIRVVRSIIREPARPRPRSKERPYRHRYRSETRSEGSVRFDLPPQEREPRKYRVVDYDGESGPFVPMGQRSSHGRSDSTEVLHDLPYERRERARSKEARGSFQGYFSRPNAREEKTLRNDSPPEHTLRPSSRSSMRRIEAPKKDRCTAFTPERQSAELAFVTGARGRSLSSERRTLGRDEPSPRGSRRRSRSTSRVRYSTSSDVSNANYLPHRQSSFGRQPETPTRVSRLMQRLALGNAHDTEPANPEPRWRDIEYAYVTPRSTSRGRTASRQRSPSRHRSPSRDQTRRPSYHSQPIPVGARYGPERYRQRAEERGRVSDKGVDRSFGGRVRHVRASERLG